MAVIISARGILRLTCPDLSLIISQKDRENKQHNLKAREILFPDSIVKKLLWFKNTVMIFKTKSKC